MLVFGYDSAPFVHNEVVALELTFGLVCGSVPHLLSRADKILICATTNVVFSVGLAFRSFHAGGLYGMPIYYMFGARRRMNK